MLGSPHYGCMGKVSKASAILCSYMGSFIQGNSGPMAIYKCLALATCIRSKSNSVKRRQAQLGLERMQVDKARYLCRTIGPLF